MVVDRLENLEKYASLNPLFAQAIEFLQSHDLNAMEVGKTELKGKDLVVNVAQTTPKAKEQAKLETHNEFIDIQIPLSGAEVMENLVKQPGIPPGGTPYHDSVASCLLHQGFCPLGGVYIPVSYDWYGYCLFYPAYNVPVCLP